MLTQKLHTLLTPYDIHRAGNDEIKLSDLVAFLQQEVMLRKHLDSKCRRESAAAAFTCSTKNLKMIEHLAVEVNSNVGLKRFRKAMHDLMAKDSQMKSEAT